MSVLTSVTHRAEDVVQWLGTRVHRWLPPGDLEGLDEDCGRAFALIGSIQSRRVPLPLQRGGYRIQAAAWNRPRERAVHVEDETVREGLRLRTYTPHVESGGGLVYYHGGGMVIGDLETVDRWCRWIAVRAGLVVTSVDYRRAPDHPFPAGVHDAILAFNHVAAGWQAQGRRLDQLGVGGDSAGGYLATLVAQQAVAPTLGAEVAQPPAYQWLVYPGTDFTWEPEGRFPGGLALDDDTMRWFTEVWTRTHDASDPGMSPGLAPDATLQGLPRTHVVTCEFDPLTTSIESYLARLRANGVDVAHTHLDGLPHDVITLTGVSREAARACERMIDDLRALAVEPARAVPSSDVVS